MTMRNREPWVLLVKRRFDPFAHQWALPGGFKQPDETLDETAQRELLEETNVEAPSYLEQFRAYGDPDRDPRTNVVTVAYLAVVPEIEGFIGGGDTAEAALHPVDEVLSRTEPLAFDHSRILTDAYEYVAEKLETSDIATQFVPQQFTLSQLRCVYESFWGSDLDGANFRRNLLMEVNPYVTPTGYLASSTESGGRPPELFTATRAWKTSVSPIRRRRRA